MDTGNIHIKIAKGMYKLTTTNGKYITKSEKV